MKRLHSKVIFRAKSLRFIASLVLLSYIPFALAKESTKAQGSTSGGETADASGKGASSKNSPSGASAQYFVEPDMLVYAASEKIAAEIAAEISKSKSTIVIYDQQSFASLEAYDAFRELVKTIEQGYEAAVQESAVQPAPTPGGGFRSCGYSRRCQDRY